MERELLERLFMASIVMLSLLVCAMILDEFRQTDLIGRWFGDGSFGKRTPSAISFDGMQRTLFGDQSELKCDERGSIATVHEDRKPVHASIDGSGGSGSPGVA